MHEDISSNLMGHPNQQETVMDRYELRKFKRLVDQLNVPSLRKMPNQANFRWLLANAWIENRNNPRLNELIQLIRSHA